MTTATDIITDMGIITITRILTMAIITITHTPMTIPTVIYPDIIMTIFLLQIMYVLSLACA
jgi:hypothetical protein